MVDFPPYNEFWQKFLQIYYNGQRFSHFHDDQAIQQLLLDEKENQVNKQY